MATRGDALRLLAFAGAAAFAGVGAVGFVEPGVLVWIAERAATPGALYAVAAVRVAFGLVWVFAASDSRAPKTVRLLGYYKVMVGIATALTGLLAVERARSAVAWWLRQGPGAVRLSGIPLVIVGGFVAYACAPARRGTCEK